jgi:hypothetical protein
MSTQTAWQIEGYPTPSSGTPRPLQNVYVPVDFLNTKYIDPTSGKSTYPQSATLHTNQGNYAQHREDPSGGSKQPPWPCCSRSSR